VSVNDPTPGHPADGTSFRLVLPRHGESEWNAQNRFTGWANPALTQAGEREAVRVAHTSLQRRAIRSAELALAACDRDWIPVRRSWRLNGRHYGALQGRDKGQVLADHGEEQVLHWRRSSAVPPPPLAADAEHSQFADPALRYAAPRGPADRRISSRRHRPAAAVLVRRDHPRPAR